MNEVTIKSVFGVLLDGDEVLFLKRSGRTSRPGQWGLPGGGIKIQESAADACAREILEETGLKASIGKNLGVYGHTQYFLCSLQDSRKNLCLAVRECSDASWSTPIDCLELGEIMDLGRLIPIFESLGMSVPELPPEFKPRYPD